jgi:tetratricopeptide (TPR) repeat protein
MNLIYTFFLAIVFSFFASSQIAVAQTIMHDAARAYKQQDYETAIQLYSQAIDQGIVQGNPYLFRGLAYFYKGDGKKALEDLETYIQSDKNNADVYNVMGLIHYELGDNSEAKYYYDLAVNADPNFSEVYVNRGMAWRGLTTPTEALKDFDKAIKLNPKNAFAYYQRSGLYYEKEKYAEALRDIRYSADLGKKDPDTYLLWGQILYSTKKYEEAIQRFTKGLSLAPKNIELLNSRAVAYQRTGKKKLAEADLALLENISGIEIAGSQKFKRVASAQDVMKFDIPDNWVVSEKRDKEGEIVIHAVPDNYKNDPSVSPVGVKFIYYTDVKKKFKGKGPADVVQSFEDETKFQGYQMHHYMITQRKYKKYGGTDFALYTVRSQNRPSDKPEILVKSIANLNNTILIGYMYSLESQYDYMAPVYERVLSSLDFSKNKYLGI